LQQGIHSLVAIRAMFMQCAAAAKMSFFHCIHSLVALLRSACAAPAKMSFFYYFIIEKECETNS